MAEWLNGGNLTPEWSAFLQPQQGICCGCKCRGQAALRDTPGQGHVRQDMEPRVFIELPQGKRACASESSLS